MRNFEKPSILEYVPVQYAGGTAEGIARNSSRVSCCASVILPLVLTYYWFDEIEAGRKNVEYRKTGEHWGKRIWDNRDKITYVQFSRGYTSVKSEPYEVTYIDIGDCPYDGWDDQYYRIYFKHNGQVRDATEGSENVN